MAYRLGQLFWIVVITSMVVAASSTRGDDTEIYLGLEAGQEGVNPNVLFIIDTSGSMGSAVEMTTEYDPSIAYDGAGGSACSDDSRIFFADASGGIPECNSNNNFSRDRLVCSAAAWALFGAAGVDATGRYTDQLGGWRGGRGRRWTSGDGNFRRRDYFECEDDAGEHGASDGGPAWPIDGREGPWSSSAPRNPTWTRWETYTLFSANYLRWYHYHSTTRNTTRLDVVKSVAKDLVDSVSDINIGLMRFDPTLTDTTPPGRYFDSQGGPVVFPMTDIDAPDARSQFKGIVDSLTDRHYTPLSETLYEAMLYYRGEAPKYGVWQNGSQSHPASISGGRYDSPIDYECNHNYIVLLSDGVPTFDDDADDDINSLLDDVGSLTLGGCRGPRSLYDDEDDCLDELAEYLYVTDSAPWLSGKQNITTYTVGFDIPDGAVLESVADKSRSRYFFATNARDLSNAFTQIIQDILRVNTTFTSPAVSVNAFNRLAHRDELYFTVFRPDNRPHWAGNVKKYRLAYVTDGQGNAVDRDRDGENDLAIIDANGEEAIDPGTGFFEPEARSFWTLNDYAPDGDEAGIGALASRLYDYGDDENIHDPGTRAGRVFTYTATDNGGGGKITDLTDPANLLHESNAYLPGINDQGRLGRNLLDAAGMSDEDFLKILSWARGLDVNDEDDDGSTEDGRPTVGAPLHGKPLLVTYLADSDAGLQSDYLFVATNDGYLHMLPTADPTGEDRPAGGKRLESWTYMPPGMLGGLRARFENVESAGIEYGLDGSMDLWMNDINGDFDLLTPPEIEGGTATLDAGEHAYLYFGERRGGRTYHALDVSNPARPAFLWSVTGDAAGPDDPISRLGQTWSRPRHTRVYLPDERGAAFAHHDVIIVGGGYDPGQDNAGSARSADDLGNAVFILDAETGDVLWWASDAAAGSTVPDLRLPDMRYSIPGDIRIIDINGDGVMDRFFAADMGGQIWRFDIANDVLGSLGSRITGGRIADLQKASPQGVEPDSSGNRRFYYPPDVALIVPRDGDSFHSIAIGSGYRAHPNDTTIQDRIYVLKDYHISSPPRGENGSVDYTTLHEGDLLDVTDRLDLSDLSDAEAERFTNGWYISLAEGEKALSGVVTANGTIMLTTFRPAPVDEDNPQNTCAPSEGTSRIYALNAISGGPVADLDGVGGDEPETHSLGDRYQHLERKGIAPEVTILFPSGGSSPVPIVGTELVPVLKIDNAPEPTYWYEHDAH